MRIKFQVEKLCGWLESESGLEFGERQVARGREFFNFSSIYEPVKISPASSRRLSLNSLIATDLALLVSEGLSLDHLVFASRFGEYNCSIDLITGLQRREEISPMKFSHSVHNTALGVFAMQSGYHGSGIAIADGESTFVSALVACGSYLSEYPERRVMLVYSDAALSPHLDQSCYSRWSKSVAVAMILRSEHAGPGTESLFSMLVETHGGSLRSTDRNQAWEFIKGLSLGNGDSIGIEGRMGAKISF